MLMAAVEQQDGAAPRGACGARGARGARGGPAAVEQRFAVVRLEMQFFWNALRDVCH
jgi:hypothetical protein